MKTIKKIIYIACATALTGITSSCDDMLDTVPQGVFTNEQIGDGEAVDLMTSAYATLLNHYFGNNESFAGPINNWVFDVRSDDAYKGGDGVTMEGYIHQLEMGNVQSDNDVANFKWRNNYFSISRCNTAIRAIQASSSISDADKAAFVGEMKTLRAYYYFDMLRIFAKFTYFDETVTNPSECRADQYTRDQIAGFIKQDLRDSYEALPDAQTQVGRFNKYVAAALLARVDLFTSDWAEAEKYAGYVISSGKYALYNNFLDMSKPEYNNQYESVMAIQFSSANSPDQYNFNNCLNCTWSEGNLYGNGDDFYLASQNLVNAFRTDDRGLPYLDGNPDGRNVDSVDFDGNVDPRLDFTVGRIGMQWRSHMYNEHWCRNFELYGQYSGKKPYPAPESPYVKPGIVPWGASSLNTLLIRYADVMLMKAEALIEQGKDLDEARKLINDIRRRAARSVDPGYEPVDCNPMVANYLVEEYPATGWTREYARKAVRMERRIELAMEGLRWFDLVRWGNVVETMNAYYASEVKIRSYYQGANRVGMPWGWENLPQEISSEASIAALRQYSANGGSLFLANMATQLTVPLHFVPENMAPTVYGNGDGGSGDDVWVINPYLGWDFRGGSDQGFYDRTAHAVFKGLVLEDPNGYGYENLPLIGPGQREDHNCLWDCNIYGRGNYPDVIRNFEVTTNSLVLATWGHVRDHCVAGLVEFNANTEHGRCIAMGLAAYEWNQNSGVNPYQHNIEQLTKNILDYLK